MKRIVFISSTYHDLSSHRRTVWDVLEDFEVSVQGMEEFGARSEAPLDTCLAEVEQSDIYIGLIAYKLGSIHEESGKSFTQLEYERAYDLNKEILIYLIDETSARVTVNDIDRDLKWEKLEAFKKLLKERHTVDTFVSETDLAEKLKRDFKRLLTPKKPLDDEEIGEFENSSRLIEKFLLMPKAMSGREIQLKLKITGSPFPASREICTALNYEFGSTIGVSIEIEQPSGFERCQLKRLYLDYKQTDEFLPVREGDSRDVYAKLQFIDSYIENTQARFERVVVSKRIADIMTLRSALGPFLDNERVIYEPDGTIALALTKQIL